jgi:hypothetical protein
MTNNLGWEFPVDPADQWRGFNDPGIEHFRGDPFGNLAREILQNSLDAATGSPVIVKFAKQDVLLNDVPNIDELRSSFTKCLTASQDESPKAKEFFEQAAKILSSKRTSVESGAISIRILHARTPALCAYAFTHPKGATQ